MIVLSIERASVCVVREGGENIPSRVKSYWNSAAMAVLRYVHKLPWYSSL